MPASSTPINNNRPEEDDEPPPFGGRLDVPIVIDDGVDSPARRREIRAAVIAAARHRGGDLGEIGVRVTDDETIRQINVRHLRHDYPTDVISFPYELAPPVVEGELVVSVETAVREAESRSGDDGTDSHRTVDDGGRWTARDEFLLYVVHGTLHVAGMDDRDPADRAAMRRAEEAVLTSIGVDQIRRFSADAPLGNRETES